MKNMLIKKCLLVLTGVMLLSGCSNSAAVSKDSDNASENVQTEAVSQETKLISEIYDEITNSVALVSPYCWDDEFISNYYGIDVEVLEEYVFSMSEDATSAETIVIMKVKDTASVSDISDCLQVVVDEKKNEMENYLPEQFEIVSKSSVQTEGNYVWLVISENAENITQVIKDSLK